MCGKRASRWGTKKRINIVVRNRSGQLDERGKPSLDKRENVFIHQVERTVTTVFIS
jgi:hypothetical protein